MGGVLARLPSDMLAMIRRGVSVQVGSRGPDLRPSLARAVGSRIEPDIGRITVYLWQPQAVQLLADIEATGQLAVVFSRPRSHVSVQFKSRQATQRPATDADRAALQRYLAAMEDELDDIGFARDFTRALLAHRHEEVVAVSFEPEQAFDQTPGPRAGTLL